MKTMKILGKRGRITIPQEMRRELGLAYQDILCFESDGKSVTVRQVKICGDCISEPPNSTDLLTKILDELTPYELRKLLVELSVRWASLQREDEAW